jgi:hypothetical protein
MDSHYNTALAAAACLSAIAALLHVGIIVGGPAWYRFFGAGERLASAAAAGEVYPTLVTAAIALALAMCAAYACAGAGLIGPLPFAKPVLGAITAVYLLRGLVIVPLLAGARPGVTAFWLWSSLICLGYGVVHLVGVVQVWAVL